jgi:hypothetical protein
VPVLHRRAGVLAARVHRLRCQRAKFRWRINATKHELAKGEGAVLRQALAPRRADRRSASARSYSPSSKVARIRWTPRDRSAWANRASISLRRYSGSRNRIIREASTTRFQSSWAKEAWICENNVSSDPTSSVGVGVIGVGVGPGVLVGTKSAVRARSSSSAASAFDGSSDRTYSNLWLARSYRPASKSSTPRLNCSSTALTDCPTSVASAARMPDP